MKKECNIIRDLLPNYIENLVSKDTKEYIEKHINECSDCKNVLEIMQEGKNREIDKEREEEKIELDYLKKYRRKMFMPKVLAVIGIIAVIIFVIIGGNFSVNYMRYTSIAKNIKESSEKMKDLNNYSTYMIYYNDNKETGEIELAHAEEYYYKDGKYKQVNKWFEGNKAKDVMEAVGNGDIISIEYGEVDKDQKIKVYPKENKLNYFSAYSEKYHYIDHLLYANVLGEIISADNINWRANFAIDFIHNSIRNDKFMESECYVIRTEQDDDNKYQELWIDKESYRLVKEVNGGRNSVITLYNIGSVTDADVEFNQAEYQDYTVTNATSKEM